MAVARGWERRNGEGVFSGVRVSLREDEKVLEVGNSDGHTTACVCLTRLNCAPKNGSDDES